MLIIASYIPYKKVKQFDKSVSWVIRSGDVKSDITEVLSTLKDAETGQRGYLLSNDSLFLEPYIGAEQKINQVFSVLDTMVAYNHVQHNNFLTFKKLVGERFFLLKNNISILSIPQIKAVRDSLLLKGKNKMDEIRKHAAAMLREEDELLQQRLQTKNQSAAITPLYLMGVSLLSLIALAILFLRLRKEANLRMLTDQINTLNQTANKKVQNSENNLRNTILKAPVAMCIFKEPNHVLQLANERMCEFFGQRLETLINKPIVETMPEARSLGLEKLLDGVYKTGETYSAKEIPVTFLRNGKNENFYVNLVYEAYRESDGKITGIIAVLIDVTEQVLARKGIEESEQRIRLAVESGRLGTFEIDLINNEIVYSERLAEIFGLAYSNETSHLDLKDALHPNDISIRNKAHDIALKTGSLSYEARVVWKDGSVHWIRTRGRVIKDNNVTTRLYGTVLDITEEKEAANKLITIKEQLELTLRMVPAAIQLRNSKGELLFVNNEAARITGFSSEEEMMREKDPDYVYKKVVSNLEIYDEAGNTFDVKRTPTAITFATGQPAESIYRTVNKNTGQSLWIMSKSSALLDENGKVSLVISTNTDITQQKKGEEELKRFKHMADNATESFILMRQDATFAYLNEAALEHWGYTKEEANQIRVPDVDAIYNDVIFNKAFAQAQHESIPQFETVHKKKDGTIYPVEVNMSCLILDGKPHIFAIARDITERKKIEEAQQESQKKIRNFIEQAPVAMCLYRGPKNIIEIVNKELLAIWDKPYEAVIGKPVFEVLPEVQDQGFKDLLQKVFTTGEKFTAFGTPIMLTKDGKLQKKYVNLGYQAYRETDGTISGIVEVVSDVTEQVEAIEKIKVSEERFGAAVAAVQGIVWTNNANGEMEGEQPAWATLTGQSYDEYQGYGWAKHVHPDDAQPTINAWNIAIKERKVFIFEHRLKMANGQWGHFSIRAIPLLNTDGSIREWVGVHTDITQKRIAEEALAKSEENFKSLANSIPQLAWMTDGTGWVYWYNQRWYDYTGTTLEQMEGWGWQSVHHPDLVNAVTQKFKTAVEKGENWEDIFLLKSKEGEYRWFLSRAIPIKNEVGKIVQWFGTDTDITDQRNTENALKESEARFRLLADIMPQQIWTGDEQGKLNYFNKAVYQFSGLTIDDIQKEGWIQIVHPEDREANISKWIHSVQTGEDFFMEHRFKNSQGEYRWQLSRAVPYKDNNGALQMWVGTSTDIHDKKMIEQQKDDFISIASHEMKTPLTTAKGYLELLLLTIAEENPTPLLYAKKASNSIERLHDLVAELLDASKIQNGKLNYNVTTFDFNEMLDETIENIQHSTSSHKITKNGNSLHQAKGDKQRLQQVIINLLTNAIKYSPNADSVLVEVVEKQNLLQVSVKDFGVGMNKQHLDKIFDRYYRVQEHAIHFQGLGIGLYISYDIINRHEGTMWAESEPGIGSTFYFTIPIYLD